MQKWHVHCALGRSRPSTVRNHEKFTRHFTNSAQPAQESSQDSNSFRRLQYRNNTQRTDRSFQPSDPLRERAHDRTGRASGTYMRSILRPDAVDARDLAAVPNPTPPPPGRSISDRIPARRAPLDARNLGSRQPSDGPHILRTNVSSRDDRGPRFLSRRDPSDRQFQGGSTNASHTRSRGPPNGSRGPPNGSRGTRSNNNNGAAKNRSPGFRASAGGGDKGKVIDEVFSEEELQHIQSTTMTPELQQSLLGPQAKQPLRPYNPADTSLETLTGMGPALACGERGMSETVIERLLRLGQRKDTYDSRIASLAAKWSEGEFCHFSTPQEKIDTVKTVERNLAGTGDNAPLDEAQEKEKTALVDTRMQEEGEKLAGRLLRGEYRIGPLGTGPTAELLEQYTMKNGSYMPKDRQALASKVGTLLPMKAPAAAASASTGA